MSSVIISWYSNVDEGLVLSFKVFRQFLAFCRRNQYGGTGVTLTADMKSRMASKGSDPTKLGRWTWVRIEGKAGESTVFVSAYRPCKSTTGMDTVWNQHVRYYQRERDIEEPDIHDLFLQDLCTTLANFRDSGDHVVLGMDVNDDVRVGKVSASLTEIGIEEAVIKNHRGESVPATCARNTQRKPIDSIWTSPGLDVLRCGFLPFHSVYGLPSDHRMIWVEICNQSMFGHRPQHISRAPVSKVKSNDPANREKYIEDVLLRFESEDIMLSFATLQQYCESQRQGVDVQEEIEYLHEELSTKMHNIRSDVDSNLSKFYNGSTPWSP